MFGDLLMQVFLDALSHVIGQVQSKQLLLRQCRGTVAAGRLQLLGMLLGVNDWTESFHQRLMFPRSCVEEVAAELEAAVEVSNATAIWSINVLWLQIET